MSDNTRYNRRISGFTLVELVIVTALIAIIIPSVTMLLASTIKSYKTMYIQNRVASSANFALRHFTRDVNDLESIESSNESKVVFTTGGGTSMEYRLTDVTFQSCSGSCESEDDYGDLAQNVSKGEDESRLIYYDETMSSWDGDDVNDIRFIELVLVLNHPDGKSTFATIVHPDNM